MNIKTYFKYNEVILLQHSSDVPGNKTETEQYKQTIQQTKHQITKTLLCESE